MAEQYGRVSQAASTLTLLESVMPWASTVTATISHPAFLKLQSTRGSMGVCVLERKFVE